MGISLIHECSDALPCVHFYLLFRASPYEDPPHLKGLTSFTCRLLLRGAADRNRRQFEEALDDIGVEVATAVRGDAVSLGGFGLLRHLDDFLGLIADAAIRPRFESVEVERLRREMLAEIDTIQDEDAQLARLWFRRTLFGEHPFAYSSIGTRAGIEAITSHDLQAHHQQMYHQGRALVGASGAAPEHLLRKHLDTLFADLPLDGTKPLSPIPFVAQPGLRVCLVRKPQRSQVQILLGQGIPNADHPDFLALQVAVTALGGTFSSRLMTELRTKRSLTYGAHAWIGAERMGSLLLMGTSADATRASESVEVLLEEYARFVDEGLSDEEALFARDHLLHGQPFAMETASMVVAQRVRARLVGLDDASVFQRTAHLAALTPDRIREVVRRHLSLDSLSLSLIASDDDGALRTRLGRLSGLSKFDLRHHTDPI